MRNPYLIIHFTHLRSRIKGVLYPFRQSSIKIICLKSSLSWSLHRRYYSRIVLKVDW
jgi:hypothetical protein